MTGVRVVTSTGYIRSIVDKLDYLVHTTVVKPNSKGPPHVCNESITYCILCKLIKLYDRMHFQLLQIYSEKFPPNQF